jgi:TonB family protein
MAASSHSICKILVIIALSVMARYTDPTTYGLTAARAHSPVGAQSHSDAEKMTVDQDLTALMVAVSDQEFETLKELLRGKPDLAAKDTEEWTAVTYAALNRDVTIINALIAEGADLNSRDNEGMTPLMQTAIYGKASVAQVLLNAGVQINALNNKGETALTLAERRKYYELVKLLRKAGGISPQDGITKQEIELPDQTSKGTRPVPLKWSYPSYTEKARHDKVQGVVRLHILVAKDGSVAKMRAITGLPDGLTQQAYRAAYQSSYIPATKDGEAVSFWQVIEVEFNLLR